MRTRTSLEAIGVGACVNMGGTFFTAFMINSAAMHFFLSRGVPLSDLGPALGASTLLLITLFAVAIFFAVLGGYAAARIAGYAFFAHSFLSGIPVLLVNVIGLLSPIPSSRPLLFYVGLILSVPLSLVGAYFAKQAAT